jgi:hypothetical protein
MSDDGSRWARRTPLLLALLLALPLFTGCKGGDTLFARHDDLDDPLKPGGPIPEDGRQPQRQVAADTDTKPTPTNPQPASGPTPPLPGAPTGSSTTALTSGVGRSPSAADDPRAKGPPTGATVDTAAAWQKPSGNSGGTGGAPVVRIEATEPAPTPAANAQQIDTLEQGYALLAKYGMTADKMVRLGQSEVYSFECTIPSRKTPNQSQFYQVNAASRLAAMKAVIEQIQRDQQAGN